MLLFANAFVATDLSDVIALCFVSAAVMVIAALGFFFSEIFMTGRRLGEQLEELDDRVEEGSPGRDEESRAA